MRPIYFLFGIHNHQPVGNFEEVFEEASQKAYLPFLDGMLAHPRIKWNLHCTGILWEWLEKKHPEYLEKVKIMVRRNQLELLSGGYYEPILAVLPDEDKIGQIQKLNRYLKEHFEVEPAGMWCAERVWEPHLPKPIQAAQILYTVLDDAHFLSAGLSKKDLLGYYRVEEQSAGIDIFPISQELRYTIPFASPEKSIEILKQAALSHSSQKPAPLLVMADDGEKFGLWPDTFKLVYKDGWLKSFLKVLEKNSDWIQTETFSAVLSQEKPIGRIYLPVGSYFEMSEWSLPTEAGLEFEELVQALPKENKNGVFSRFVRGGIWRNFLAKYPESNAMYKKMLRISQKVHQAAKSIEPIANSREQRAKSKTKQENSMLSAQRSTLIAEAKDLLWAGQCNCAYWHGVFGGLYLPILRQAVYKNLIEAEKKLDQLNSSSKKGKAPEILDLDGDGWDEVLMEDSNQSLVFSPASGGTLMEWDFKPASLNLLNVLTRRPEVYHKKIQQQLHLAPTDSKEKSIHEKVVLKEKGLENLLTYDWYRRTGLIDHFLHPATTMESFQKAQYGEEGDFVLGSYSYKILGRTQPSRHGNSLELSRKGIVWVNGQKREILVEKIVTSVIPACLAVRRAKLVPEGSNRGAGIQRLPQKAELEICYRLSNLSGSLLLDLWFAPEFNFAFSVFDRDADQPAQQARFWERKDPYLFWKMNAHFSEDTDLWIFPLETVSNSEGGYEKTFQGITFLPNWRFSLKEKEIVERKIKFVVEKTGG